MSTKAQVIAAICANLQLPGVNDSLEAEGTGRPAGRAGGLVYNHLPPFIWTFVVTTADGLDAHDVDDIMDSVLGIRRSPEHSLGSETIMKTG